MATTVFPSIHKLLFAFVASTSLLVGACSEHENDDTSFAAGTGGGEMGGMGGMGDEGIPEVIDVAASDGPFETEAAPDLDPSPEVVEVELEAKVAQVEIA